MAITCTPSELLDSYKCLQCLSEKELKAVIVLAFATTLDVSVTDALANSACFTCLSDKQKLQSIAAILGDNYLSAYTVPEIRELIKCLLCATPGQLNGALIYLICQYLER